MKDDATLCSGGGGGSTRSTLEVEITSANEEKACLSHVVDWDSLEDVQNPRYFPSRIKWRIASLGIVFCAIVSLCVTSYSISLLSVEAELQTTSTLAILGITLFTITFGSAPLLSSPLSEKYGRTLIYILSAWGFTLFFIPQALARNIETILVSRFLSGIAGSSAVSLVGGSISDLFNDADRGLPMSVFAFAAFFSTGAGPVMFSFCAQQFGFRLIMWIMFGTSALFSIIIYFLIEETRANVLLEKKAARVRKETGDDRYHARDDAKPSTLLQTLARPVKMLFFEPVVTSFAIFISFCWMLLYLLLDSIPIIFTELYGFDTGVDGLIFSTSMVGCIVGVGIDWYCAKLYRKNVHIKGPEARLYTAMAGGVLLPIGAWIYTFTSYSFVHFIAPCVGISILYAGMYLVYVSVFQYLSDAYGMYASSALSAQSFLRNVSGALFPLIVAPLYAQLGIQGAGALVAGIATLLSVTPFLLFRYGAVLRARSPFARELAYLEEQETKNRRIRMEGDEEEKI